VAPEARGGVRSLDTRVASTDDDDVEMHGLFPHAKSFEDVS
jgi:hypothetical protein